MPPPTTDPQGARHDAASESGCPANKKEILFGYQHGQKEKNRGITVGFAEGSDEMKSFQEKAMLNTFARIAGVRESLGENDRQGSSRIPMKRNNQKERA